ncbi:MAG: rhamnose ABC transporter substrate-binding protein [Tepidisphaeraceae bacterium]
MRSRWIRSIGAVVAMVMSAGLALAAEKPTLVYIPKNTGNPYFDPLTEGFKKAVEESGCEFVTVAPDSADATSQLPLIKDQIQQGVAAITISPNSPDALNPVFEEAMGKGIHVVTVDSDLTGNEEYRTAGVATVDPESVGAGQIELLGSMISYEGEFAILSATTDAPNQNRWIEVMKKTLADNPKYAKMKLLEVVYGNDEPQKSSTETESLLARHPNLKGIIAPTTVGIAAAAQVVETRKVADKVVVTGLGTPNQMRRFVKNGTVKVFALWSPYDEGYLAGQIAAQLALGKLKAEPNTTFTAGTLGERKFREKNVVITGDLFIFNKDTIDKFNF